MTYLLGRIFGFGLFTLLFDGFGRGGFLWLGVCGLLTFVVCGIC